MTECIICTLDKLLMHKVIYTMEMVNTCIWMSAAVRFYVLYNQQVGYNKFHDKLFVILPYC